MHLQLSEYYAYSLKCIAWNNPLAKINNKLGHGQVRLFRKTYLESET